MRMSRLFGKTLREEPADADTISHSLLLKAGLISPLTAGVYSILPLGWRAIKKIERIIREEMDAAGGQELHMPALQPVELWLESGRRAAFGETIFQLKDRRGRELLLAPTHEEVVTQLVRQNVSSYRDLPLLLYQVQTKFRDEPRPRAGLLRVREFDMKDLYSFDADEAGLDVSYRKMLQAYRNIFARCGLPSLAVEADSGAIGGKDSHEFIVLAERGEDLIIHCPACGYAANQERATSVKPSEASPEFRSHRDEGPGVGRSPVGTQHAAPSSPSPRHVERGPGGEATPGPSPFPSGACPESSEGKGSGVRSFEAPLEEVPTPGARTIAEVSRFLGVPTARTLKAVFYSADRQVVLVMVRGDLEVNEVKLKNLLKATDLRLADERQVQAAGLVAGAASPIGIKGVKVVADDSITLGAGFVVGANKPDTHYRNASYPRDFSVDLLADIASAEAGHGCPRCGKPLEAHRGIEVGHVFKLGTVFSEKLAARYLDKDGSQRPIVMGSYGIGVGRLLAAAVEQNHDEQGIVWPAPIAPYHVHLVALGMDKPDVAQEAERLYDELRKAGLEVLLDDRDESPGVKFNDADLLGMPVRLTVSPRTLKQGVVELKRRTEAKPTLVPAAEVVDVVRQALGLSS